MTTKVAGCARRHGSLDRRRAGASSLAAVFADVSPIDEATIAEVARGGAAEVDAAVAAARAAFGRWSRTDRQERAAILHAIADGVERRLEDLAAVETTDNGALIRSHRRGVMPRVAHNFRFFADWLVGLDHPDFDTRGHRNHVSWDPAGVCALITPWNAPLMLATWKVAPALAAGNTVVLKPAEWSPLTASLLADIAAEAGLPAGVLNVVQGYGEEAGAALVAHPDVARISFTGSVPTARLVAAAAAPNLTPLSLELGGKSPLVVFADADLDLAVATAVEQYDNAGQVCLAGTRLLVESSIADEFTERFLAAARRLRQGDPRDEETDIGPLIHRDHLARVDGFVRRATADGARAVLGGGPNAELGGLYYQPTLFVDAQPGTRDPDRGGLRPGADAADVRRPRRRRSSSPTTRGTASPRRCSPAIGGAGRAGLRPTGRRHRVGELLLRPGPPGAVRWVARLRDRPRGRDVELRLLLRREEHRARTEGMAKPWVRSSARACCPTYPRSCCRSRRGGS